MLLLCISIAVLSYQALDFSKHLGTKSPYLTLKGLEAIQPNKASLGCKLIQLQTIVRHGTRNPSDKDIIAFDRLQLIGKEANLTNQFKWLQSWKSPYKKHEALLLNKRGEEDLYNLGKRTRENYQSITKSTYDPLKFAFHSSSSSRTSQSASAFALGLLRGSGTLTSLNMPPIYLETFSKCEDTMLDLKHNCQYWKKLIKNHAFTKEQLRKFTLARIRPIAHRISLALSYKISSEDVKAIYKLCAFEIAIHRRRNTWCELLEPDDVVALEYYEDLGYYYKHGYGHSFNGKVACAVVTSLMDNIEGRMRNSSQLMGAFKFGHSQTIQFLITALGLFKDTGKLTWDLAEPAKKGRRYKTSKLCPFASNLYVEVYQCDFGAPLQIRFLINETPVKIPKCSSIFCPLDELKLILKPLIGCNFTQTCESMTPTLREGR